MRIKRIALLGVLTAAAIVLSWVEHLIPFDFGVPGIKLGLANVAVVFALYRLGLGDAVVISLVRILISGLTFGGVTGIFYSLCGGFLSLAVMLILKKCRFSVITVSASGGVAHNIGQIACAVVLTETLEVSAYLPVLMLSGILTGVLIGVIAGIIIKRIEIKDNVQNNQKKDT